MFFYIDIWIVSIYRLLSYRPAIYFCMAFVCTLLGAIIMGLMTTGVLPPIFIVKQAPIIGNALELILLSLGLADKFNLMKEKALEKEAEAKKVLKNQTNKRTNKNIFEQCICVLLYEKQILF